MAIVTRDPRFISRLPSESTTCTFRSGLPNATPRPMEDALLIELISGRWNSRRSDIESQMVKGVSVVIITESPW